MLTVNLRAGARTTQQFPKMNKQSRSLESDTDLTATFTEAETLPPIEDLQIEVLRINGEEPDNGVIEYGEIESAVVSVELRITGPNGDQYQLTALI